MAKDGDTNINDKILSSDESTSNKSFVKKVKSRVSDFIPSSLSRWFGSADSQVRYREESDDEEEESFRIQPPTKRIKPNDSTLTSLSNYEINPTLITNENVLLNKMKLNSVNHVENKLTFPEPIAGPSGYNPKKSLTKGKSSLNKLYTTQHEVINGDKYSDSGESVTSGYSSMNVGSKDVVTENKNETVNDSFNKLQFSFNSNSRSNDRSLFSDHCTSPQVLNSSLSTRQPAFNASIFGSPTFVDRTISSKRILNSPFYSGRTTYGGASAYGRTLASNEHRSSISRNSVQIKPINERTSTTKNNTTLSKTARRILDTLEQYTTPITDAKKIPNPSIRKKYLNTNKPYPQRETKVPSSRELQVPTVPDLLKMKLKERLQESTVSVRQIANSSKSVLNKEEYTIKTLEPDSEKGMKHSNKMKNKISSVRQKNEPHRTVEEVKLPDIQLPISSLPKFDFCLPPIEPIKSTLAPIKPTFVPIKSTETVKTSKSTLSIFEKESKAEKCVETKKMESTTVETCSKDNNKTESNKTEKKKLENTKITEFKFSDPVIIAENLKSIRAINNFIFSEPTSTKTISTPIKDVNKDESRNISAKNNGECKKESTKSILKVLNKDNNTNDLMAKFKPSNDTWECTICLIRNVDSKNKCAACETPRPQNKIQNGKPPATGFGDKFKMADGQWSCKICLIVNPPDKNKCVACESPKEGAKDAKTENAFAKNPEPKSTFSFGVLPDKTQWECTTCLIRNKATDVKCVACTAAKPTTNGSLKSDVKPNNSWGDKFKAPTDTWSCDTCMVRNNNNDSKCVACQNPRSNKAMETSSIGFDEKFKKKDDQWECDSCMVRNSQDKSRCLCCDALKPGAPNPDIPKEKTSLSLFNFGLDPNAKTTISGFSFGIKPAENKKETAPTNSIFGQNATTTISTPTTFSFGVKPTAEKVEETPKAPTNSDNKVKEPVAPAPIISTPQKQEVSNGFTINPPIITPQITKVAPTEEIKEAKGFNLIPPKVTESTTNIFSKEPSTTKLFSFGATPTPVSTSTTSIFGTTSSQTNSFNNPTTPAPAKTMTFGTTNPQPIPLIAKTTTSNPFSNVKPNLFGGPPVETKAPSVFGSTETNKDDQPPAKMPLFSFGQPKKSNPDPPKFGFGALQPSSSNPFSFGQSAASTVPNLSFTKPTEENGPNGAVSSMPVFNFGPTGNTTPKTGFTFGASQPSASSQATPNATSTVPPVNNTASFNFGPPPNVTAPSAGGFNFNPSASTEFRPNFNFTSGATSPPTFNAQQNPSGTRDRVIRRAIRRSHR